MSPRMRHVEVLDHFPRDHGALAVEPSVSAYDTYLVYYDGEVPGEGAPDHEERETCRSHLLSYAPDMLRALKAVERDPDDPEVRRRVSEIVAGASTAEVVHRG